MRRRTGHFDRIRPRHLQHARRPALRDDVSGQAAADRRRVIVIGARVIARHHLILSLRRAGSTGRSSTVVRGLLLLLLLLARTRTRTRTGIGRLGDPVDVRSCARITGGSRTSANSRGRGRRRREVGTDRTLLGGHREVRRLTASARRRLLANRHRRRCTTERRATAPFRSNADHWTSKHLQKTTSCTGIFRRKQVETLTAGRKRAEKRRSLPGSHQIPVPAPIAEEATAVGRRGRRTCAGGPSSGAD